jgi:hypothetical protein
VIELVGAHPMKPDSSVTGFFTTSDLYGFDAESGATLFVPKVSVK